MHENHRLKMPATLFSQKGSRRDFLRNTAVTALGGTALAACSVPDSGALPESTAVQFHGVELPNQDGYRFDRQVIFT